MKTMRITFGFWFIFVCVFAAPLCAKDQQPVPVFTPRPIYPPDLLRANVKGEVYVEFIVDTSGMVAEAHVAPESESEPWQFKYSSVVTVWHWRFKPGLKDGKAVNTRMKVPMVFDASVETAEVESRPKK